MATDRVTFQKLAQFRIDEAKVLLGTIILPALIILPDTRSNVLSKPLLPSNFGPTKFQIKTW